MIQYFLNKVQSVTRCLTASFSFVFSWVCSTISRFACLHPAAGFTFFYDNFHAIYNHTGKAKIAKQFIAQSRLMFFSVPCGYEAVAGNNGKEYGIQHSATGLNRWLFNASVQHKFSMYKHTAQIRVYNLQIGKSK